jgi:hypothetical protein
MGQDGLDAAVAQRLQGQGSLASGLQPGRGVALAQPQNAEAGTKALFEMAPALQDGGEQGDRVGAGLFGPAEEAFRRPARPAMRGGHMGFDGGEAALEMDLGVRRHPLSPMEHFHRGGGVAEVHLPTHQGIVTSTIKLTHSSNWKLTHLA